MSEDPYGTEPMFDTDAFKNDWTVSQQRPAREASVGFGPCPGCTAQRMGAVRTARHLAWRYHEITTWSGARLPCQASGIPVCGGVGAYIHDSAGNPISCLHVSTP